MFRLVEIPTETASVEFRYLPPGLQFGGAVSAIAVVFWLYLLFRSPRAKSPTASV